jgi:aryl-alcohol dehydrogenase-like predicted oxidoreductase
VPAVHVGGAKCSIYGEGESERKVGLVMAERRGECILATKCHLRERDEAAALFASSLDRLQTDHVDVLFMHHVQTMEQLERMLAPDGALLAEGEHDAMKAVADGLLWRSAEVAFRYAWSLPIHSMVAGMDTLEILEQDLALPEAFKPLSEEELERLYAEAPELGTCVNVTVPPLLVVT